MKTIYIIRHAKSSWANFDQSDFERPLNDRGHKDAPAMAKRLLDKKIDIDGFISSPALRARQTCEHFCKTYKIKEDQIVFIDSLYHAAASTISNVISKLDDRYKSIAVFTHNPGITEYVDSLIDNVEIDNMPTCGIFAVEANTEHWKDFPEAKKTFLFFDYPKNV
jgi:phosphohistidine phosphatase